MSAEVIDSAPNEGTPAIITEEEALARAAAIDDAENAAGTAAAGTATESCNNQKEGEGKEENTNEKAKPVVNVKDEPKSVKEMISHMLKSADGTNVMAESIKTMNMVDGIEKKNDVVFTNKTEGLIAIKAMIEKDREKQIAKVANKKKQQTTTKNPKITKWEFRTSPHEQFGKTLDDTFLAFIQWARIEKDEEDDDDDEKKDNNNNAATEEETSNSTASTSSSLPTHYNVSKAFRRLEHYAEWMEDAYDDLIIEPLTVSSFQTALDAWGMRSGVDKYGHYVWFIDIEKINWKAIKEEVSTTQLIRTFVWYSHYLMYNDNAQQHGVVIAENVANAHFMEIMTCMPMKVRMKIKRLTMGVMPVKMKKFYIMEIPKWVDLLFKFLSVFLSKKMKSRMIIIKEWEHLEQALGPECIPKNFGRLKGTVEIDPIQAQYFSIKE